MPPAAPPAWLKAAPALFLLLWSSGFVVLKVGLAYADPMTFLALRYACVVVLLTPVLLLLRPPMPRGAAAWGHLAMVGLLLQAGYFCFTYLSLKQGMSAGGIALITSLQPILIGLLAPAIAHEQVDARRWAGLGLGVSGAALVIVAKASIDVLSPLGLLFAVGALLCITGGTLYEKRFGTQTHPVASNMVQYAVGLAVTAPLAFWLEPMRIEWTGALWASLAYLVVGNSLVAITLLLTMIRHGEASRVSALFFLVPPCTAVIALAILDEPIPALAWPGMALAAIGILLVTRAKPAAPR
ncbi:DMT family transporter [Achromobacter denitrificans]|uniref:DMT family transporter n=1 Tax=Achromobacter denitrificans TaxID=32002 RepID=UPI000F6872BF|nr:DMT family transporter [Achromobacter denitrificans]MDF3857298.1 DMT family transporter [Achromobacter denitrificans]MDF3944350.1 DMT family transporter [Achromobacter denitrificans]RSE80007.1 DMT family transporter [Achromobacter denitrificans]